MPPQVLEVVEKLQATELWNLACLMFKVGAIKILLFE